MSLMSVRCFLNFFWKITQSLVANCSDQTNHQNGPILYGKVLSSGFQNIQCTINPKLMSNTKSNFNQQIYKGCKNISIVDIKKQLSFKKSITADIQTHFLTYWTLRTMGYPETYWMKVINLCIPYREMFSNTRVPKYPNRPD